MSSSYGNKLARALISSQAHLKACKAIKVSFNPWQLETKSIRDFYHYIQTPSIRISNENCKVQTDIRSDLCEPLLEIKFSKKYFSIILTIINILLILFSRRHKFYI
jgi:hypothetical protein